MTHIKGNKMSTIDDIDSDDYPAPHENTPFYDYYRALWEMRFGYQEDKSITFEENLRSYIKYNHKRNLIKRILDIKTEYYYESGEVI